MEASPGKERAGKQEAGARDRKPRGHLGLPYSGITRFRRGTGSFGRKQVPSQRGGTWGMADHLEGML